MLAFLVARGSAAARNLHQLDNALHNSRILVRNLFPVTGFCTQPESRGNQFQPRSRCRTTTFSAVDYAALQSRGFFSASPAGFQPALPGFALPPLWRATVNRSLVPAVARFATKTKKKSSKAKAADKKRKAATARTKSTSKSSPKSATKRIAITDLNPPQPSPKIITAFNKAVKRRNHKKRMRRKQREIRAQHRLRVRQTSRALQKRDLERVERWRLRAAFKAGIAIVDKPASSMGVSA